MTPHMPHETLIKDPKSLPVMLPGKLVGRETLLAQVYAPLKTNGAVMIHGPAGVGKTALAATLASAYAQQTGGVLWMNVDDPTLDELLVRVGRAYDVREIVTNDNPISMIGAVENTLKSGKPFIVIDGDVKGDVLSRFISRCVDNLPMIITSREAQLGAWELVEIPRLEADQAAALFKREGRVAVNEHDIDVYGIVKQVDTLPFGIIVAARAMVASKQDPAQFINVVQQISTATNATGATAALSASFRALNGALQGLVLMMGALFDNSASVELLSQVSGAPEASVKQAMDILTQLHMVERTQRYGQPYYAMHAITYAFAQAYLKSANKLDALQTKALESVVAYAQKYSGAGADGYDALAMEIDSFMATARWAANHDQRSIANDIATALSGAGDFLTERGYLYESIQLRALGSTNPTAFPAYSPEPLPIMGEEEEESSEFLLDSDALEEVEEDEIAPAAASPEDLFSSSPPEAAPASSFPSDLFDDDDDIDDDDEGLFDDDDDESLFDEDDSISDLFDAPPPAAPPPGMPSPEDSLPGTPMPLPELDLEYEDSTQLRTIMVTAKQQGTDQQLSILKSLGERQVAKGRTTEAINTYNEILTLHEAEGDDAGILEAVDMLSALLVKTENAQAAVMHASRGIKLAADLDDDVARLQLFITLGDARQQLGEPSQAREDYRNALAIARSTDDTQNEAIVLYKLGFAQLDDEDTATAIETFEQALSLFKAQNKRAYEGRVMGGLGSGYADQGNWSEAVRFHTSAMYIAREMLDKKEEAIQLGNLAHAAQEVGQLGEAVLRYRQLLHLALESEDREDIVSALVDLARLLLKSAKHASIAQMLVDEAMRLEPNDRDVTQLHDRVEAEIAEAQARGVEMLPVKGSVQLYAQNAYALFEG